MAYNDRVRKWLKQLGVVMLLASGLVVWLYAEQENREEREEDLYIGIVGERIEIEIEEGISEVEEIRINPELPEGLRLTEVGMIEGKVSRAELPVRYVVRGKVKGEKYKRGFRLGIGPSSGLWITNSGASPYELRAYVLGRGIKQGGEIEWKWRSRDEEIARVSGEGVVEFSKTEEKKQVEIEVEGGGKRGSVFLSVDKVEEVRVGKLVTRGGEKHLVISEGVREVRDKEFEK